ncbi:MAG: flagellar basal body rod protein FlgC [Gemmatimonadaceae bacterium]
MTMPPIANAFAPVPALQRPELPRQLFSSLAIASSGLTAQRVRMDVVAQNLANADTTRTAEGGPYQRRVVTLEATAPETITEMSTTTNGMLPSPIVMTNDAGGVRVASIGIDKSEGAMVYNPGSPDADKNGYVHMPNVSMTDEMMDLMNSRRLYEANATVFQVARAMLHKAIDI